MEPNNNNNNKYEIRTENWQKSLDLFMFLLKNQMPVINQMNSLEMMLSLNKDLTLDKVDMRLRVTNCPVWFVALQPKTANKSLFLPQKPFLLRGEEKGCVLAIVQDTESLTWQEIIRQLPLDLQESAARDYRDNLLRLERDCGLPNISIHNVNSYLPRELVTAMITEPPLAKGTTLELPRTLMLQLVTTLLTNSNLRQHYLENAGKSFSCQPRYCLSKHLDKDGEISLLRKQVNLLIYDEDPLQMPKETVLCDSSEKFFDSLKYLEKLLREDGRK